MKSFYLFALLLLSLTACQSDEPEIITPAPVAPLEFNDWIILTAPENGFVEAVYGNIDSTLIISLGNQLYRTLDQGKTWQTTKYASNESIFGFSASGDTINAYSSLLKIQDNPELYIAGPRYYSLDYGKTWKKRTSDDSFSRPHGGLKKAVTAANGITYKLVEEYKVDPSYTIPPYVDKAGLQMSDGRVVYLPQVVNVKGISLDSRQRVYLACSAVLCQGKYCSSRHGQVFISKKPLP